MSVGKIANLMKEICQEAGLKGNFTNHSGRSTAVVRMVDAEVDVNTIRQHTGHTTVDGLLPYQQTSVATARDISWKTNASTPSILFKTYF